MVIPKKDRPPVAWDERDLVSRAYTAYFKKMKYEAICDQPNQNMSGVTELDGKVYVVLTNGRILAAYRLRNDGVLKGLRRIPKAVSDQYEY